MHRRFKQASSFAERLAAEAERCREAASHLPPGQQRDLLLQKARQADTAAHIDDWVNSRELRSPE